MTAKSRYNIPEGSLEKVTKDKVKKFFSDNGIGYKMPQPSGRGSDTGMSDFQALRRGLFIAIEAKRNLPSAKPTELQKAYLKYVNDNGGLGVVVKCEQDILDLEAELISRGVL